MASNPYNLKHKTSTIDRVIVERDAEALNQGKVVHIETTAGKQVINQLLHTPPLSQRIKPTHQESTNSNDASATHSSQTTDEPAVVAESTDFDPLQYMKRHHRKVVVVMAPNKKNQEAPLLMLDRKSVV